MSNAANVSGSPPPSEAATIPPSENQQLNEVIAAYLQALDAGRSPDRQELLQRYPDLAEALQAFFADHERMRQAAVARPAAAAVTLPPPASEAPGTRIGRYKLLQQVGEGGMGTVWMAEQMEPVRRTVALKVVKAGFDSAQVVARFEAERQALALMDHPNIAKVLDAGTTEAGRPYFVMELVKGTPITRYCDAQRLTLRERLELFTSVCQAIQHAHQKGIIHRDIKPSNVLIAPYDGKPVVKVIDFGVAKATGQRLTDKTMFTEFGAVIGTLEYMSPEQAELNNQDIDTRSDIYSLGVLLYQLLTGTTPLNMPSLRGAAMAAILMQIQEAEPPKPSTRLGESKETLAMISAQRQTDPARLAKMLRGELDWIVMKALDKERSHRYETANSLAVDVQRYLADEPVEACPPSAAYRLKKLLRRHKGPVAAAALIVLVLLAGLLGTSYGLFQAKAEKDRADEKAVEATAQAKRADEEALAAQNKAKEAADERNKARSALDRTERGLTTSKVAQANIALRDHDPGLGLSLLETCRPETRFWEWYYTRRLCRGAPLTLHQDGGFVDAAFSPDRRWIAAIGTGLTLLDAQTGAEQWRKPGVVGRRLVAFSPDGGRVATWVADLNHMTLKVWEVSSGKEVLTIPAKYVRDWAQIVFSPDGHSLACAGVDDTTTVWDADTGNKKFDAPLKMVYVSNRLQLAQLAYTPDGSSLAIHDCEEVRFLDPVTGKEQRKRIPAKGFSAVFSPDGRYLAMKTEAVTLRVLDLKTGDRLWENPLEFSYTGSGTVLRYSPDGERLAYMLGSRDGFWSMLSPAVYLLDAADGKRIGALPGEQLGIPNNLSFSPGGQRLAVCYSKTIQVWNVRDLTGGVTLTGQTDLTGGPTLRGHSGTILDLAFSPNRRQLLTIANTGAPAGSPAWEVKHWDADCGFGTKTISGYPAQLSCAAFNAQADRVAVGGSDYTVRVCDTATGRELLVVGLEGLPADLAFSQGGDFLAVLLHEDDVSRILILDAISGRPRRVIAPRKRVEALVVSPDGRSVAGAVLVKVPPRAYDPLKIVPATLERTRVWFAGGGAGYGGIEIPPATLERIQAWSVKTGEEQWRVSLPANRLVTEPVLAFSPDGRWLAGNTTDQTVTLWDAHTGAELLQFKVAATALSKSTFGGPHGISTLTFSTDSQRLAAGCAHLYQVKVWDTTTGQEAYSFNGTPSRLAFRADNLALAAASYNAVSLLSAETVPSRTYLEGTSTVAVFSLDGRLVAVAGNDNDILLFDAFTGQLRRRLEGHTQPIASLAFSDDAKRLVSTSSRPTGFGFAIANEAKVWNVETGNQLALFDNLEKTLTAANGTVLVPTVTVSADGSHVAVAFGERSHFTEKTQVRQIHVWDVATRRRLRPIHCTVSQFGALTFAEDGKVIAIRNEAGNLLGGWSVETGSPVQVVGEPFAKRARDKRTEDGRQLGFSNGESLIQPEPDERQRARLRAQGQPDLAWHAEKARAAETDKQWFSASFHLGRLLLESRGDGDLLCRRARAYMGQERWQEARADCNKAVRLQPNSVEAWVTRALLEYRQRDLKQAHADLARAAAAAPDEPAVAAWQAFLYVVDKQEEKATASEKRMREQLPFLLGVTGNPSEAAPRGPILLKNPSPAWALLMEELTQRLAVDANAVSLLRLRGVASPASGKTHRAVSVWLNALIDLQKATTLEKKDVLTWKALACALWQGPQFTVNATKQGLDACDAILRLEPQAWEFLYLRGLFCALDRQHEAAVKAYTQALELHRDFAPALHQRGMACAELGQWDKAVADFTRAAEFTGQADPTPWDALALAQLARGDPAAYQNYQKTCNRMLALFGRSPQQIWAGNAFAAGPLNPYGTLLALHFADQAVTLNRAAAEVTAVRCTTRPDTLADWQRLIPLTKHGAPEVRGKVFCRTGRFDEAVKLLEPLRTVTKWEIDRGMEIRSVPVTTPAPMFLLYLALAEHGRGRSEEAKRLLKETSDWLTASPTDKPKAKNRDLLPWSERVQVDQLRREIEALLR